MKILFVIPNIGKGGAERVLSILANYLNDRHEIEILKFDNDEPFYEISKDIKITNANFSIGNSSLLVEMLRRIIYLRKAFKKRKSDVIISFLDYVNILSSIANFGLKNKLIIAEHSNYNFLQGRIWRFLRKITYYFADGLTVLTRYDSKHYTYVKNVTVMPNPMFKIPKISEFKKENIILAAGRLIELKGFDIFLKALNKIDKNLLDTWKIIIVGDGTERQNLQNLAKELNLSIEFTGFVKNIDEYYKKAKIVVVTSRIEGFCNILMESIYFDVARISTDCIAGPSELIEDGKDGFLCEVDNTDEIAKKLEILMRDENLREEFIKNANLRRDDYSIETIGKKWLEFINLIVEKK